MTPPRHTRFEAIRLRLEAYEASTRNFLKAVSNYTQRAVTEITNRKTAFAAEKKKIAEKTTQIETETNQCKLREIELIKGTLSPSGQSAHRLSRAREPISIRGA